MKRNRPGFLTCWMGAVAALLCGQAAHAGVPFLPEVASPFGDRWDANWGGTVIKLFGASDRNPFHQNVNLDQAFRALQPPGVMDAVTSARDSRPVAWYLAHDPHEDHEATGTWELDLTRLRVEINKRFGPSPSDLRGELPCSRLQVRFVNRQIVAAAWVEPAEAREKDFRPAAAEVLSRAAVATLHELDPFALHPALGLAYRIPRYTEAWWTTLGSADRTPFSYCLLVVSPPDASTRRLEAIVVARDASDLSPEFVQLTQIPSTAIDREAMRRWAAVDDADRLVDPTLEPPVRIALRRLNQARERLLRELLETSGKDIEESLALLWEWAEATGALRAWLPPSDARLSGKIDNQLYHLADALERAALDSWPEFPGTTVFRFALAGRLKYLSWQPYDAEPSPSDLPEKWWDSFNSLRGRIFSGATPGWGLFAGPSPWLTSQGTLMAPWSPLRRHPACFWAAQPAYWTSSGGFIIKSYDREPIPRLMDLASAESSRSPLPAWTVRSVRMVPGSVGQLAGPILEPREIWERFLADSEYFARWQEERSNAARRIAELEKKVKALPPIVVSERTERRIVGYERRQSVRQVMPFDSSRAPQGSWVATGFYDAPVYQEEVVRTYAPDVNHPLNRELQQLKAREREIAARPPAEKVERYRVETRYVGRCTLPLMVEVELVLSNNAPEIVRFPIVIGKVVETDVRGDGLEKLRDEVAAAAQDPEAPLFQEAVQRAVLAEVVRRGLEARLPPAQARHEQRCLEAFFWGVQGENHPLVDQLLQMGRMTRLVPEPKRVPGGKPLPTWHPAYKP